MWCVADLTWTSREGYGHTYAVSPPRAKKSPGVLGPGLYSLISRARMPAVAASHRFAPRSGREIALSTVLPFGLLNDRRIDSLLWVGEPVDCSLENGHCVASLTRRHRL